MSFMSERDYLVVYGDNNPAPLHNRLRLFWRNPETFDSCLAEHPLDADFVNWAYSSGFWINYNLGREAGSGRLWITKEIEIGVRERKEWTKKKNLFEIDIIIMHELIHVAVPHKRIEHFNSFEDKRLKEYEAIIDKHATKYAKNSLFMDYVKHVFGYFNNLNFMGKCNYK